MPNGGSDCCGTCWFNSKNEGEPGYHGADRPGEARCTIRDLEIPNPFWTYCANHPHHNLQRIALPIGPVYTVAEDSYARVPWVESPDTPAIRAELLRLLGEMPETPTPEYPSGTRIEHEVIRQLAAFGERAAIPGLRRVLNFRPEAASEGPFARDRFGTVGQALEALAVLVGDEVLPDVFRFLRAGLENPVAEYVAEQDRAATLRYFAVQALGRLSPDQARPLLIQAEHDPNPNVARRARELLGAEEGK